jgi:hypothetical protein
MQGVDRNHNIKQYKHKIKLISPSHGRFFRHFWGTASSIVVVCIMVNLELQLLKVAFHVV